MKNFTLVLSILLSAQIHFGQVVTDQKEAERIYKESVQESKVSKQYFAEIEECRNLLRREKYVQAEIGCRLAISTAEKFPKSRYMEKHSAYKALGVALLWQRKAQEAISYFDKSLEVGKPNLDDSTAETGEIYFLLGQSNHFLGKLKLAEGFYTKAESVYRSAFKIMKDIDSDEFLLKPYGKSIVNILKAHLILLESGGMKDEAAQIEKRLTETALEFAKYLDK